MKELKMFNTNLVVISGRLCAEPEVQYVGEKGTAVCGFRIAVSKRVKKADEWQDEVSFFNVTAWGYVAENVKEQLQKGSPVLIEGELKSESYETKDGQKRTAFKIVARKVHALERVTDESLPTDDDAFA